MTETTQDRMNAFFEEVKDDYIDLVAYYLADAPEEQRKQVQEWQKWLDRVRWQEQIEAYQKWLEEPSLIWGATLKTNLSETKKKHLLLWEKQCHKHGITHCVASLFSIWLNHGLTSYRTYKESMSQDKQSWEIWHERVNNSPKNQLINMIHESQSAIIFVPPMKPKSRPNYTDRTTSLCPPR